MNKKRLDEIIDESIKQVITEKRSLLAEMARIGFIGKKGELEVYIRTNDPGNIPHFHVRDTSTLFSNNGMTGAGNDDTRGNEAHVTNRNRTCIKEGNTKIDIGPTQEMSIVSKVKVNSMLDNHLLIICAEYLPEQLLLALDIRRTGLVVFHYQFMGLVLPVMRDIHHVSYESVLACDELHYIFLRHNSVSLFLFQYLLKLLVTHLRQDMVEVLRQYAV